MKTDCDDPRVGWISKHYLLVDRFDVEIRHETKQMPAHSLGLAKNGSKLLESTIPEDSQQMRLDLGLVKSNRMSMAQLAEILSRLLGMPVVDQGRFDDRVEGRQRI